MSGVTAGASSAVSTRTPRSGICEWCGKAAKTRCSKCRQALFCDAKCMEDSGRSTKDIMQGAVRGPAAGP